MRIFVTGATGFLGGHLIARALAEGHTIVAWVRSPAKARERLPAAVELVDASGGDAALVDGLAGADVVVNLAGEPVLGRWTEARKKRLIDSRVGVTRSLVAAIGALPADKRPKAMISGSAVGYYGDRGDAVVDESSAPGSDFLAELCVAWEAAAAGVTELGVRLMILRIGIVLGRDGGALQSMLPTARLGLGGPLGSGAQRMPWIHVDDLVGMILEASKDARWAGPVNGTAPAPATSRELAQAIGRVLHRPAFMRVPAFALRLGFGEAANALLGGQRALPGRAQALGFAFRHPELDEALQDLLGAR